MFPLVWDCLRMLQEELGSVAEERNAWDTPNQPWMSGRWIYRWMGSLLQQYDEPTNLNMTPEQIRDTGRKSAALSQAKPLKLK